MAKMVIMMIRDPIHHADGGRAGTEITEAPRRSCRGRDGSQHERTPLGTSITTLARMKLSLTNLLSQWRAYSDSGRVYSLGFDSARLVTNGSGFHLLRVEYCFETQPERISSFLRSLTTLIEEHTPVKFKKHIFECIEEALLTFIVSFKSPAYSDEDEWRLVQLHSPKTLAPGLDFRATRGRIVPHIAPAAHEGDKPILPLVSVTVGPASDAPRSEKSIKQALQTYGYAADAVLQTGMRLTDLMCSACRKPICQQ